MAVNRGMSQASPEKQNQCVCVYRQRSGRWGVGRERQTDRKADKELKRDEEIYFKKLPYSIIEAGNSRIHKVGQQAEDTGKSLRGGSSP